MKKKNKKNQIRMRLSKILLCTLAILLCAAPCGWAITTYEGGGERDVTTDLNDDMEIKDGTTVNLYTSVSGYIQVHPGGVLNIYSGSVFYYVLVSTGEPEAVVCVYGTNFAVNGVVTEATEFTPLSGIGSVLTGNYGGDGGPILPSLFKLGLWFISQTPIYLKAPALSGVEIDIKPGGNPNNINPRSKGVVPVAVLTTGDFDASTIDPDTVEFAGAEPVRWKLDDVDDDGDEDILFHFKTQDLLKGEENLGGLDEDSKEATLTCKTNSGEVIAGTDEVWIVPGKN